VKGEQFKLYRKYAQNKITTYCRFNIVLYMILATLYVFNYSFKIDEIFMNKLFKIITDL